MRSLLGVPHNQHDIKKWYQKIMNCFFFYNNMTYIKIDLFSIFPLPMTNLSYKLLILKSMVGPLCITHLVVVVVVFFRSLWIVGVSFFWVKLFVCVFKEFRNLCVCVCVGVKLFCVFQEGWRRIVCVLWFCGLNCLFVFFRSLRTYVYVCGFFVCQICFCFLRSLVICVWGY